MPWKRSPACPAVLFPGVLFRPSLAEFEDQASWALRPASVPAAWDPASGRGRGARTTTSLARRRGCQSSLHWLLLAAVLAGANQGGGSTSCRPCWASLGAHTDHAARERNAVVSSAGLGSFSVLIVPHPQPARGQAPPPSPRRAVDASGRPSPPIRGFHLCILPLPPGEDPPPPQG